MRSYREEDAKKTEVMWEKEEKDKHSALWAGVLFFVLLVGFLWLLNIKSLFENFNKKKTLNINQFSEEFSQVLDEVKVKVDDMKVGSVPSDFSSQTPEKNKTK